MAGKALQVVDRQHMGDFFHRRVDDEGAAEQRDRGVDIEPTLDDALHVEGEEGGLKILDRLDHHEQEDDAEKTKYSKNGRKDVSTYIFIQVFSQLEYSRYAFNLCSIFYLCVSPDTDNIIFNNTCGG